MRMDLDPTCIEAANRWLAIHSERMRAIKFSTNLLIDPTSTRGRT
jgi:hypothetical protein